MLLASGLLVSFKGGCNFDLENVNTIEKFEGLKLRENMVLIRVGIFYGIKFKLF